MTLNVGDEVSIKGTIKKVFFDGSTKARTRGVIPDDVEPWRMSSTKSDVEEAAFRPVTDLAEADAAWEAGWTTTGLQYHNPNIGWVDMPVKPSDTVAKASELRVFKDWKPETTPPIYTPPEGVYGPVLGKDVPEGWERHLAHSLAEGRGWFRNTELMIESDREDTLYWVRKPAPKTVITIGKTYKLKDFHIRPLAKHDEQVWCSIIEGGHNTYTIKYLEKNAVEVDQV